MQSIGLWYGVHQEWRLRSGRSVGRTTARRSGRQYERSAGCRVAFHPNQQPPAKGETPQTHSKCRRVVRAASFHILETCMRSRRWLTPVLTLSLLGLGWTAVRPVSPNGPELGGPLATVDVDRTGRSGPTSLRELSIDLPGKCILLTAVSESCSVCRRMRLSWALRHREWETRVGRDIPSVWIVDGALDSLAAFVSTYSMTQVVLVAIRPSSPAHFRQLGVWGTPTTYLLDDSTRLIYGMIGNGFPPDSVARQACASD